MHYICYLAIFSVTFWVENIACVLTPLLIKGSELPHYTDHIKIIETSCRMSIK